MLSPSQTPRALGRGENLRSSTYTPPLPFLGARGVSARRGGLGGRHSAREEESARAGPRLRHRLLTLYGRPPRAHNARVRCAPQGGVRIGSVGDVVGDGVRASPDGIKHAAVHASRLGSTLQGLLTRGPRSKPYTSCSRSLQEREYSM